MDVVTPNSISRNYSHSLFRVDVPDNQIGDAGATALVEGIKEMRELKELHLRGEFGWMLFLAVVIAVPRWCRGRGEVVGGDGGNRVFECTPPESNYDTIVCIDFAQYAHLIAYMPMRSFFHQGGGVRGEVV